MKSAITADDPRRFAALEDQLRFGRSLGGAEAGPARKRSRISALRPTKPRQPGGGRSTTACSNQTPPGDIHP